MKILVADDDPQILRALRVTLRARGYDIVVAPPTAPTPSTPPSTSARTCT